MLNKLLKSQNKALLSVFRNKFSQFQQTFRPLSLSSEETTFLSQVKSHKEKEKKKAFLRATLENTQSLLPTNKSIKLYASIYGIRKTRSQHTTSLKSLSLLKVPKKHFSEEASSKQPPKENEELQAALNEEETNLMNCLQNKQFADFLTHANNIYTLKKQLFGENYETGRFTDLKHLGYGNFLLANYTEALFFYDESLKFAKEHQELAEVHLNLGQLYRVMNNEQAALDALNEAYAHGKTSFSINMPLLSDNLLNIAYVMANITRNLVDLHRKQHNLETLKGLLSENIQMFCTLMRQNFKLSLRTVRDFMTHLCDTCEELASLLLRENKFDEALEVIDKEMQGMGKHPSIFHVCRGLFNKGLVYTNMGKLNEAWAPLEKAKQMLKDFLFEKPKDCYLESFLQEYEMLMHMIYGGLANALLHLKEKQEGLKLIAEIEEFSKTHPSPDPFVSMHVLAKKAEFLILDEKFEDAWNVLVSVEQELRNFDLKEMKNLLFRSYILMLLGNVGGELEKCEETLPFALENEGLIKKIVKEYPNRKEAEPENYYVIGALYGKLKKYTESRRAYEKCISAYKSLGGERPYEFDRIYTDLGSLAEEEGNNDLARKYFLQSLEIRKKLNREASDEMIDELKSKIQELEPKKEQKTPKKK